MMFKIVCLGIRISIIVLLTISTVLIATGPGLCLSTSTTTRCKEFNLKMSSWEKDMKPISSYRFYAQYVVFSLSLLLLLSVSVLAIVGILTRSHSQKKLQLICCVFVVLFLAILGSLEIWIATLYKDAQGGTIFVKGWKAAAALYFVSLLLSIGDVVLVILMPQDYGSWRPGYLH